MKRTGAEIVWETLVNEGVDTVFGYPGGGILRSRKPAVFYCISLARLFNCVVLGFISYTRG